MTREDRPPRRSGPVTGRGSAAWARLALLALAAGVLVPLVAAGLRSVLWVLLGMAGLALAAVGLWWALAHAGTVRMVGSVLCVVAPLAVLALYAAGGMLAPAALSLGLWALAVSAARAAVAPERAGAGHAPAPAPPPRRPWALMNPRSGGGKVERFRLVERARSAGVRVVVLGTGHQDVAGLAEDAVREGADLLAVAGGDGTQALVAEVASRHDLPFMVVPAGTRNHFALDLGLDREDPAKALDALTDGVELRVDLGFAADRVFVNNASFGTYAAVVGDPAYREEKRQTTLRMLPGLLSGPQASRLRMRADGTRIKKIQTRLVRCNHKRRAVDTSRPGRREKWTPDGSGWWGFGSRARCGQPDWRAGRTRRACCGSPRGRWSWRRTRRPSRPVWTGSTCCCRCRWCAGSCPGRCGSASRAVEGVPGGAVRPRTGRA
ncbi:conserved hypothetical protein [Streptomyces viridosporus ATCC 14672]|uniref:DAGKc domain-containing protein n=1 Tax=Streptomyces viridosporus (strain ATCC 14672 / DSM 40746 / JCM 4963 / KCTC 9882 / NRRL B-12104 / FH 1290) TaxID=566461 RepID=D5ZP81_STRV1|nr:conserved hypothetical protein [Streptomyces viridosporus ATCC 14672]